MRDERLTRLARQVIEYSVALQKGEHVLIHCTGAEEPLVRELIDCALERGAYPHLDISNPRLRARILGAYDENLAEVEAAWMEERMAHMSASISVSTFENPMEYARIAREKLALYSKLVGSRAGKRERAGEVRWCVLIYPTPMYAYGANMSTEEFENYYFKVCCLDYARLGQEMDKLRELMEKTHEVRIVRPDTDLTFSIDSIGKMSSKGDRNVPDGEVYTAPKLHSVNGHIRFNVPSIRDGVRFEDISLRFKEGRVIEASSNETEKLNRMLDTDAGARYTGEFAFGVNPYLKTPIGTTLFDEKINGSIHIALGNALDLTDNGNRSAIHWDMVAILREEYGGGEVYFDGQCVQRNGLFLPEALQALNHFTE